VQISRREFLASAAVLVKAKHKPDEAWKEYPTRTVADVKGLEPYRELLEGMRELNGRVYQIAERFR
jgi:hypothetical protein